jgi:[acyl-carrier-protein] S-malonyltransferase
MAKIAFIFPGQGSQAVGMGRELYNKYNSFKKIVDEAETILNIGLRQIIFEGSEETLKQTQFTQPAIFVISAACLEILREKNINPEIVAGHSLGEYTALFAAGSLSLSEALGLIQKRSQFMQEAGQKRPGGMAAIIGLDINKVNEICQAVSQYGLAEPVNFNCPGQIVIAGDIKACEEAVKLAQERGALKAIKLEVSGAFHSSLMNEASQKFHQELTKYEIKDAVIPVITNFNASQTIRAGDIRECMVKQVNNPVRWEESINKMLSGGIDTFIEVGPGRVLSGLVKRINKSVNILNVENEKSLAKTLEKLMAV